MERTACRLVWLDQPKEGQNLPRESLFSDFGTVNRHVAQGNP